MLRSFSGPINTIAVHPAGKAFASGGEDGYVRVHWVSLPHPPNTFCQVGETDGVGLIVFAVRRIILPS